MWSLHIWRLHMWRLHICGPPWLRKMQICATIVAQNAYFRNHSCVKCKFAQPKLQILSNLQENPCGGSTCGASTYGGSTYGGSTCGGSTYVDHHGCAKCQFAQPKLRKMHIFAIKVAQILSNLQENPCGGSTC